MAGERVIDAWVNVSMGDSAPAPYLVRVKEDYLKGGDDFFRSYEPDDLLPEMDRLGIERAIIVTSLDNPNPRPLRFVEQAPERFSMGIGVGPTGGVDELHALEDYVAAVPTCCVKVVPFSTGVPPSDAIYYPLYAKCIDLDIPLTINTGLPGPPVPGECQDPIHLDKVCFRFPELKLCMAHGADPWWGVAMRLMIKYANLHLMTSAYSPKHFPPEFVHFMNTRGQDKVLFASDHPAFGMARAVEEARALDLREGVLDKFLYANANRLFFGDRKPRHVELAPLN